MSTDSKAGWIPIAEAVARIARGAGCTDLEARRRIANRFHDREFRIVADKVVSQVRDAEYLASLLLGETLQLAVPPMVRTVDERIQLTPLMFPPGALESDSPLWTGEASFPVPHEGPLARASYYGIRIHQSALMEHFPEAANGEPPRHVTRAPSVKTGRAPSIDAILAKADEMKSRGLTGRKIAQTMRLEPGFENVATTEVRDLIIGRWKPSGRPKKTAS